MRQFVKLLPKGGEYSIYLCSKFSKLFEVKLKEGVFTSFGIQKLLFDPLFLKKVEKKKKKLGTSLKT
jgi:hypothetical protein